MTMVESGSNHDTLDVDLRLAPALPTRHDLRRQIARLEERLVLALSELDAGNRPTVSSEPHGRVPRILDGEALEATRDSLAARLAEVEALVARQAADHADARALLKRMTDDPAAFHWATVSTKDLGDPGCKIWQSVPVMGPIGILNNWWRIRMSSGCP